MYGYAGASAAATQLTPFTEPVQTTNASGLAAQSAAIAHATGASAGAQQTTLSQLIAAIPSVLQGLSSSTAATSASGPSGLLGIVGSGSSWLDKLWALLDPNSNFWNTIASSGLFLPSNTIAPFWVYSAAWQLRMRPGMCWERPPVAGSVARWWRRLAQRAG